MPNIATQIGRAAGALHQQRAGSFIRAFRMLVHQHDKSHCVPYPGMAVLTIQHLQSWPGLHQLINAASMIVIPITDE